MTFKCDSNGNKIKNPFINLILSCAGPYLDYKNFNIGFSDASITLFKDLLGYSNASLNEKFYFEINHKVLYGNLALLLFNLCTKESYQKEYVELFEMLVKAGLNFESYKEFSFDFQNKKINYNLIYEKEKEDEYVIVNPFFSGDKEGRQNKKLLLFVLKNIYESNGKEKFFNLINEFESVHRQVQQNNFDVIEFYKSIGVNFNLKNENQNLPLMFVKNIDMIKLLHDGGADLNGEGAPGDSVYSHISSTIKKETLPFKSEILSYILEESTVAKSKRDMVCSTVIDLFKQNLPKTNIESFLKKNKVKDFNDYVDENGDNLLFLAPTFPLKRLFETPKTLTHINNNEQCFSMLLLGFNVDSKNMTEYAHFLDTAIKLEDFKKTKKSIFLSCLEDMISIKDLSAVSLPKFCSLPSVGSSELLKEFKKTFGFTNIFFTELCHIKGYDYNVAYEHNNKLKLSFYFNGFLKEGKEFKIDFDKIFKNSLSGRITNTKFIERLEIVSKYIDENNIGHFDREEMYRVFNEKFISIVLNEMKELYLQDEIKKYLNSGAITSCFNFMNGDTMKEQILRLPDKVLKEGYFEGEVLAKVNYALMGDLQSVKPVVKKANKI
jgi:hypothetical protein